MSETEHEPIPDEADAPVSPERLAEEGEVEEAAEEAETGNGEASEAAAPKSEKEIEKALKAVERAGTTYRNAVSRAMGEDAQGLVSCPRCNAPVAGMIFPPDAVPVDDETREAVLASVGQGAQAGPPLQPAEGVETCPKCLGNGRLEFPTLVEHTRVQTCVRCSGSGYINAQTQEQNVYTMPPAQTLGANATGDQSWNALPDSWGRPVGHPHYGRDPVSVTG